MKAAVISLGSVSSKWVAKAMKKYFDEVDDISLKNIEINLNSEGPVVLVGGQPIEKYDCIYLKGSFRYNHLMRSMCSVLYKDCYMPLTPEAFTIGHDKLLTQVRLMNENISMPTTYLASSAKAARKILEKVNYPIMMKFPEGTQGVGVMFADSFPSANSMLDALTALRQPFLIQEYIDTSGVDIRAVVVGDRVVASMKRKALNGEKRSNIHSGSVGETYVLDGKTRRMAVEAAKAIGAEICAVDILESAKGPLVIEVNLSPGLQGITKTTKVDVADKIAKFLHEKTKEFAEQNKKTDAEQVLRDVGIEKTDADKEIITHIHFRGNRILLPEMITDVTGFNDKEELVMVADKGKLVMKKFYIKK